MSNERERDWADHAAAAALLPVVIFVSEGQQEDALSAVAAALRKARAQGRWDEADIIRRALSAAVSITVPEGTYTLADWCKVLLKAQGQPALDVQAVATEIAARFFADESPAWWDSEQSGVSDKGASRSALAAMIVEGLTRHFRAEPALDLDVIAKEITDALGISTRPDVTDLIVRTIGPILARHMERRQSSDDSAQLIAAISQRIAERLFTNGDGQAARRLVLELSDGSGGKWSKGDTRAQVDFILQPVADLLDAADSALEWFAQFSDECGAGTFMRQTAGENYQRLDSALAKLRALAGTGMIGSFFREGELGGVIRDEVHRRVKAEAERDELRKACASLQEWLPRLLDGTEPGDVPGLWLPYETWQALATAFPEQEKPNPPAS